MQAPVKELAHEAALAPELKRGGVGSWLSLVAFSLRNWFVSWAFFLPNFVLSMLSMLLSAAIFYFMGETVSKGAEPHIEQYGLSYGSYMVTGVMFNLVMGETLDAYHNAFLRGYWTGQFDIYLQHPGGVTSLLAGEVIAKYLLAGVNTLVYFLMGVWVFGVPVQAAGLLDVVVILGLAVLALTGLGLVGASTFSLLNAKREETNPVKLFFDFGVTLLAGLYFPATVLPGWLQKVGYILPQTHALNAARLCLSGKASLSDPVIIDEVLFLLAFAAVSMPVGILLFRAGIKKAEREGSLTRWS
jgi:ABC-2 type transport system permease protein